MSKKTNQVVADEIIEVSINEIISQFIVPEEIPVPAIHANIDQIIAEIKATATETEVIIKDKPKAKAATPAITFDLPLILAATPDTFTPAFIDAAFGLNDGGKTVRRHLRKHFADELAHNHKDKWGFTKSLHQPILEYFASRYTFIGVKEPK